MTSFAVIKKIQFSTDTVNIKYERKSLYVCAHCLSFYPFINILVSGFWPARVIKLAKTFLKVRKRTNPTMDVSGPLKRKSCKR